MALKCTCFELLAVTLSMFTLFSRCHAHFSMGQEELNSQENKSPHAQGTPDLSPHERYRDFIVLTNENFQDTVFEEDEPWIIILHEDDIKREWITMAASMRGLCWMGMVNIKQSNQVLQNLGIQPDGMQNKAIILPFGNEKSKRKNMKQVATSTDARKYALDNIPNNLLKLKTADLQDFIVESYQTKPSRFPAIFLTNEPHVPALYRALQLRFSQYFHFGIFPNPKTQDLDKMGLGNLQIDLPSFFVLVVTSKNKADSHPNINAVFFDSDKMGDFTYPNIAKFLFSVNLDYRHSLPGSNMANVQEIAEMTDVEEKESQRFEIVKEMDKKSIKSNKDEF